MQDGDNERENGRKCEILNNLVNQNGHPVIFPARKWFNASLTSRNRKAVTCATKGMLGASSKNSTALRRVRFATDFIERSPHSNSYSKAEMGLMWISPQIITPPFRMHFKAIGAKAPTGAQRIAASSDQVAIRLNQMPTHSPVLAPSLAPYNRQRVCKHRLRVSRKRQFA